MFEIWLTYLIVDFRVSNTSFNRWRSWLDCDRAKLQNALSEQAIRQIIELSEKVGRNHYKKMNCLRRSLTQKLLLEKRGVSSELKLGVRLENSNLAAHAWLVCGEICLNDTAENIKSYQVLDLGDMSLKPLLS